MPTLVLVLLLAWILATVLGVGLCAAASRSDAVIRAHRPARGREWDD